MAIACSCPRELIDAKGITVVYGGRIIALECAVHRREALIAAQRIIGRDAHSAEIAVEFEEECRARRSYWIAGIPTELDLHAARKAVARRLKISLETVEAVFGAPVRQSEERDDE